MKPAIVKFVTNRTDDGFGVAQLAKNILVMWDEPLYDDE